MENKVTTKTKSIVSGTVVLYSLLSAIVVGLLAAVVTYMVTDATTTTTVSQIIDSGYAPLENAQMAAAFGVLGGAVAGFALGRRSES